MTALASKMLMLKDGRLINLRHATQDDAEALLEHTQAVLADGTGMCLTPDEFQMTPTGERAWIEAFESDARRLLLVAECNGQVIGMLNFEPLPRRMLDHVGEFGMSIRPQWRGLGIGRFLLEGLLDWARHADGIAKVTLAVRSDNAPAIALYEKHGFREEGRRVGQISLADGRTIDEILMYHLVKAG